MGYMFLVLGYQGYKNGKLYFKSFSNYFKSGINMSTHLALDLASRLSLSPIPKVMYLNFEFSTAVYRGLKVPGPGVSDLFERKCFTVVC